MKKSVQKAPVMLVEDESFIFCFYKYIPYLLQSQSLGQNIMLYHQKFLEAFV